MASDDDTPGPGDDGPPRRGRPPKLTPELLEQVTTDLLAGAPRCAAAPRYAISPRTFKRWMSLGRKRPDSYYAVFRRSVLASEAEFHRRAVALIVQAGADDPANLRWVLERKFPHVWGQYRGELGELKKRIAELEKALRETAAPEAE